ncbi:hypothetical protein OG21DRAFT_1466371 [Imleria badia]|nr:hypothetical protein OG21DRAFT_1466371 [Imleria badia]
MALIHNHNCAPLDRLVTIVAYYEASCDHEVQPKSCALPHIELSPDVLDDAKNCLRNILAAHEHRDGPRVFTLLRPLTEHHILRERILTQEVLETLIKLFDAVIGEPRGNFGQAMDGLNCLLQCEYTRQTLVGQLGANLLNSNVSRLSRILKVDDPCLLIAALRMVLTLARIPDARARAVCSVVKPRIRELARQDERLVGLLAVQILLSLCDPNDQGQLNIRDAHVRANLSNALARLNPERHYSADGHSRNVDPGEQILRHIFGLDATELSEPQRKLIGELKLAVQKGNPRERTEATMTLLKLCETETIRTHLREIDLLDVFVDQLLRKGSALLAAYALVICLKYGDMKESIKDNDNLPRHIVGMLTLDYFDDAVGHVEGFQIFGDFMQHADLRKKIMHYNITEVLNSKIGKGKLKEIRTGLITLDIFRSFDRDGPWTRELVAKSLEYLQNPLWKVQRTGVMILFVLAWTKHGVAAISPRIHEVVQMLLPEGYLPIPASSTSPNEGQTQSAATSSEASDARLPTPDTPPRPPSCMLGPAYALRILAQNKILRDCTRGTMQYANLKHLYLSGTLVDETDTSPWRVRTPSRADVFSMLDKMIKAVDEELSEDGLMLIGDTVLPHTLNWNRLVTLLRNRAMAATTIIPSLLGVSALSILSIIVFTPIYLSAGVYSFCGKVLSRYHVYHSLENLRHPGSHEGVSASGGHDENILSGGSGGGSSQGFETMLTQGGGDTQSRTRATNEK